MKLWLARTTLAALLLTTAAELADFLLSPRDAAPIDTEALGYSLLLNVLPAAVLLLLAQRMRGERHKATGLLLLLWFGIQAANLVEALFFGLDLTWKMAWDLTVKALFVSAVGAVAAARFAVSPSEPPAAAGAARGWAFWVARVAVCDVAYVCVYFAAGIPAFPFVQDFYAGRPVPSPVSILQMQLVRGLVFSLLILVIVRGIRTSRRRAAVLAGLALAVLGGIHPLLGPNPFLPVSVRVVHLVEVAVSNFLFGCFAGWLLNFPAGPQRTQAESFPAAPAL